jgi:hypothetical protein
MRAVVLAALLALALPAAAGSSAAATGLRGHVTIGPLSPVCRVGTPCSGPAKHVVLSFRHVFLVHKAATDGSGNYSIALGSGTYLVTASKGVSVRPVSVSVPAGRVRVVNFAIDTGIR